MNGALGRALRVAAIGALVVAAAVLAGCRGPSAGRAAGSPASVPPTTAPATAPPSTGETTNGVTTAPTSAPAPAATAPSPAPVVIDYRVERHTTDGATAGFESAVDSTLGDGRGWPRAGFLFEHRTNARFSIILAEPDETEALCRPYDVFRKYSCQNGPTVVINAERWRHATSEWTGDLATYRLMLVNHEVGHLLGLHHPPVQCPQPGQPAAVMSQQSTELDGCLPNPWPLAGEIAVAARHDLPLAPPFER